MSRTRAMTDTLHLFKTNGRLDEPVAARHGAAALQARAAAALSDAEEPAAGQARRGPFRPEAWLNARERGAVRLAPLYFHAIDVLALVALTLLCAWATAGVPLPLASLAHTAPFVIGALAVVALMRASGLYGFEPRGGAPVHLAVVALACVAGGAAAAVTGLVMSGLAANWAAYVIWTGLTTITLNALHMGWCDLIARWRRSGALTPNIVLVGATRHAEALVKAALLRRDVNVLGIFDDRLSRAPRSIEGVPVLGDAESLLTHPMTPYVDRVVLAIDPAARARVRELTSRLSTLPNDVTLLVEPGQGLDQGEDLKPALDRLARASLAPVGGRTDDDHRAFGKRMQDLALGGLALAALSPLMLAIALLVRLDSPGPVFFRQRRHGFNQEEITVWKFRTMRHEAADATASRQVTHDDDRVTRLGRFLRATSLDELPQLVNVLKGEMSLVGPRPHAIGMKTGHVESARLVAEYAHRHRIKPGMTGWAAIKGSRGPLHTASDVRRRVQLDVEYVERQSFWLDLYIMAVTLPVLLGDRAAVR